MSQPSNLGHSTRPREWVIYVCPACDRHVPVGTCGCERPKPDHNPVPVRVVAVVQKDGPA